MFELDNIEKLIHRLRLCNTSHIKSIIFKIIDNIQIDNKYKNTIKHEIQKIVYPQWEYLYKIIKRVIKLYKLDKSEKCTLYCKNIISSIKSRMKYEEEISHILPLEQRPYASYFSNYNKSRYQSRIRRLVKYITKECSINKNDIIITAHHDKITDINTNNLFNTVKWLYRIVDYKVCYEGNKKYKKLRNYLQALHASMLINIKPCKQTLYENFCGFRMCDVCWRFIAYSDEKCCRCEIHNPQRNTREYQKATAICNVMSKRGVNKAIYHLTYIFIDRIRTLFVFNESTELYYNEKVRRVGSEEAYAIFHSIPETSNRDRLPELMQLLSRTCRYIKKQGGDPCRWESVIEILDPPTIDELVAYRRQRQWLHKALCRDPTPFQLNLAFCEAWLRLHNVKYSLAGRGGARPNSGGARPGAGRHGKSDKHIEIMTNLMI